MNEDPLDHAQLRALGAELLRAQRSNDQAAFMTALGRAERRVPGLFISLCAVANKAMDEVISRQKAEEIVARVARDLPPPPNDAEQATDAWRDAIALLDALRRSDEEGARVLLLNSPSLNVLYGMFVQVVADLIPLIPTDVFDGYIAAARETDPKDPWENQRPPT